MLLGLIEGWTEFFPISSTGHLIVAAELIGFEAQNAQVFEVVIQLGAILAVLWVYRARFAAMLRNLDRPGAEQRLTCNLILAFVPAALVGFFAIGPIKRYLFNAPSVGLALLLGGALILWVEARPRVARVLSVDQIGWRDALKVGCAQILALVPGTSRSGATIIGGLLFGLERRAATEFSFFLALPTMLAATAYDVYRHHALFSSQDLPVFTAGFVMAFVSALLAVRVLIRFVGAHSFKAFAWYRIGFGSLILASWQLDWIAWNLQAI